MKTHIALLRGINVGGNKKLPMADLRAFVETLGFTGAQTLLQSGNLVFRSEGKSDEAALEIFLEGEASQHLALSTTFILRTADEWSEVVARNPFPDAAKTDPSHLLVMFFREAPTVSAVELLRATLIGAERIHSDGRQLYATFPHGAGNSKAANLLMNPCFAKYATGRNWNTVLKLGAMVSLLLT